jgi:hypothetical protein
MDNFILFIGVIMAIVIVGIILKFPPNDDNYHNH